LVTEGTDALQVAFVHLLFNLFGILIWYPIPFMRRIPIHAARQLGKATRAWKGFPLVYIFFMFFIVPVSLLAISTMLASDNSGLVAVGSILASTLILLLAYFVYWWHRKQGRWIVGQFFRGRQRREDAMETLAYDLHYLKRKVRELQDHTNCGPAPTPTIEEGRDRRSALLSVADDMTLTTNMVTALIAHTGLPGDDNDRDLDGPNEGGGSPGRFVHKDDEHMPEVDTSGWQKYQYTVLAVFVVCFILAFWGIGTLLASDLPGEKGLGGFLAIMVGGFYIYRLVAFFKWDGKEKSLVAYREKQLRRAAEEGYLVTMAQLTADIDKLASHTHLPAMQATKTASYNSFISSVVVSSMVGSVKVNSDTAETTDLSGDSRMGGPDEDVTRHAGVDADDDIVVEA
jgi:hypothetical protein